MKRIISMLLCIVMVFATMSGIGPIHIAEAAGNTAALSPTQNDIVKATNTFTSAPRTFEATIELSADDANANNRGGIIVGNYKVSQAGIPDGFTFEIYENGWPRLYYLDNGTTAYDFRFWTVDVRQGRQVKLTIVHDSSAVHCYVDGELKQTLTEANAWNDTTKVNVSDMPKFDFTDAPAVGGDLRSDHTKSYFAGKIYDVAVWTDVRTTEEVQTSSINTIDKTDEELFVAYDFRASENQNQDLSTNGNHLTGTLPITNGALEPSADSAVNTITEAFTVAPRTFEATIELPADMADDQRGGVIIGNYEASGATVSDSFALEIYSKGWPRLFYHSKGTSYDFRFYNLDLRQGRPVRLTIVHNSSYVDCYIDGNLKQRLLAANAWDTAKAVDVSAMPEFDFTDAPAVGGDYRSGNAQYFKGLIYDVAVWSDVRTSSEIKTSAIDTIDKTDKNLLAAYNFASGNAKQDLSTNKNHLTGNLNLVTQDGVHTNTETTQGLSFEDANRVYQTEKKLTGTPYTISSWVYLPTEHTTRGGVILGNYRASGEACASFEISSNGVPRFYHINSDKEVTDLTFSGASICADNWVNLTFVVDEDSDTVSCYLNGVFQVEKTSNKDIRLSDVKIPYGLGGDIRPLNAQNFKGRILELSMYEDMLSADEVGQLYLEGVSALEKDPFAHYTLTDATQEDDIQDTTDNKNHLLSKLRYFSEKTPVTDYAYSFAVVGDIQTITEDDVNNNKNSLSKIYDWIVANKDTKNIQYVFGLGDVTDNNNTAEWQHAKEEISKLDGKIEYSVIRGNHDVPGLYGDKNDRTDYFSQYLGTDAYKNQFTNGGFFEDNNIFNSWRTFKAGENDYLLLTLDFGATDAILDWASEIISKHPYHNVIITTHAYLYRDGTTLDANDAAPPTYYDPDHNNGDDIWTELVSQHENIVLVMSGHDPYDKVVVSQDEGKHGNTVTQMLSDHQYVDRDEGPTGMVTMLYFSEDGSQVQVECFSTVHDKFFLEENQFTMELDVVDSATFTSAWVDIEDSLALNYKVKLTGDAAKETPVITIDGPGADVEKVPMTKVNGEVNTWTYRYTDIMAQEMDDTITATVSAGGETTTKTYSVLEYCKAVLEKEDAAFATEYGYTEEQIGAVRELIVDLVQYGGQAQQYRGTTDTLSKEVADYTNYDKNSNLVALSELTSLRNLTVNTEDTTYQWSGVALTLKEKVNIRAKFDADSIDNLKVQIKVGNAVKEEAATITAASNGIYYVYFDGICADQYGDEVVFTFIDSSTDQPIGKTLHYSVNSYLKNMYTNETVKDLLSAINEYGHAAKAFVASMNRVE